MAKIKFYDTSLVVENGIKLTTVISLSNTQQTKEGFEAFINEVIPAYPKAVSELEVVLTAELYQHYYGVEGAKQLAENWLQTNQVYLDKLTEHKIPYAIRPWTDLTTMPTFQENYVKIQKCYQEDSFFSNMVVELAKKFTQKRIGYENNAIQFLLEECAVCSGLTGYLIYPHRELNAAISYILAKFGSQFKYIPYKVIYKKTKTKAHKQEKPIASYPLPQNMVNLQQILGQYAKGAQDIQLGL